MSLSCLPLGPFTTMISGREGLGLGETTVPPCLPEQGFFVLVTWVRNVSLTLLHHPLFRLLPGKELPKDVSILGLVSSFIVLGILLIVAVFFVMYCYKKKGVWPHHWFFSFSKGRLDGPGSAVSIVLRFP
nr:uncharacterized protein LOC123842633 [Mirounga angustirostris]